MTRESEGGIGRREDVPLLRGGAKFVSDMKPEGCLEAHFVRSPEAHGVLVKVGVEEAREIPGVRAVFAAKDLPEIPFVPATPGSDFPDAMTRPALAGEVVRYAGEPVAVILADNRYLAEDAAELVSVETDPLPVVMDPVAARTPGAPELFPGCSNVAWEREYGNSVEDVFAAAPVVVEASLSYPRVAPTALEGRAFLAQPDGDKLTVWCSHQAPHRLQKGLARALGVPPESVRVIVPSVGGAFGAKSQTYPEYVMLAYLARMLDRPVRWIEDRGESLTAASHGRGQVHRARLAASESGEILGLEATVDAEAGAYPHTGTRIPMFTAWVLSGPYRIPSLHVTARAVLTNGVPLASYRGAGRPEAAFTLETLMDQLASATGIDPIDVRARNLLRPEDYPYTSPTGALYDSGDPRKALEMAAGMADLESWRSEQRRRREVGDPRAIGIGIGCYIERSGGSIGSSEFGRVEIHDDLVHVITGTCSTGQSHERSFARLVADVMDIDDSKVRVIQGDTALVASGTGSFASRSMQVGGTALVQSAEAVIAEAVKRAADRFEVDEQDLHYERGRVFPRGAPSVSLTLWELGREEPLAHESEPELPQAFPYGAYVAVVEVDLETGFPRVLQLTAVEDCGTIIDPMVVEGQAVGAAVQGLGQALMEEVPFSESGQPLSGTFADYLIPLTTDVPPIEVGHLEIPNPNVPHGAKGAGEGGSIGAPPAIVNAIVNALGRPLVSPHTVRLPLSPGAIFGLIGLKRAE